ncbi:EamA family transporter [Rahnella sikkimica]|uniref:EamA family transporter n=1 Tax=Rahnella sikkimica TaxID=1805933 RepID=A0A2L1UYG5_9GAMM|nr:EamA family transporter [Rahnella sikkimica]AVF37934.1 EamA family transporter [Rahnella sikkimica]
MHRKHIILAILVTAIWGVNFPITKLGLARIDPLLLTAIRFAFTAFPLVFFVKRPQVAMHWLVAYGLIFGVAMWALINLGISMGVPPGSAALLIQFSAFFTLGWGVLLFGESLTRQQLIGVFLAATGLVCILMESPGKSTTIGLILLMISAVAWSVGNIIIKLSEVKEIFAFVVWASIFSPIPLLMLTWWWHGTTPFSTLLSGIRIVEVFSLAFQVYAATHFCYWGWNLLLREYPVSRVAPWSLLIPVFGMISSVFILHQTPGAWGWVSISTILLALIIGMNKGKAVVVKNKCANRDGINQLGS